MDHTEIKYTAIFTPVEGNIMQAQLAEMPGVITAATSRERALALLKDALAETLRAAAPGTGTFDTTGDEETITIRIE